MFQNLPLPAAQEVRDSSSVVSSFSPETMRLRSLRQLLRGIRYNTRNELIRVLWWSVRNINKDGRAHGVRRLPNMEKSDKEGVGYIEGTKMLYVCE